MSFRDSGEPIGPVGSGIDCFLMQDNTILGYSTDLSLSEDLMVEGIQTLGYYGFRDFLSMGYDLNMTMGTYLLRGADIAGSVSTPGWQPDGSININGPGSISTFTGLDLHTLNVMFTVIGAKYSGGDTTIAQGALMSKSTRWRGQKMIPGLATS